MPIISLLDIVVTDSVKICLAPWKCDLRQQTVPGGEVRVSSLTKSLEGSVYGAKNPFRNQKKFKVFKHCRKDFFPNILKYYFIVFSFLIHVHRLRSGLEMGTYSKAILACS